MDYRNGVSGPAIFKFEKNYVKPSLELWLKIARDCGLEERQAVLLWVKAKLPEQYHDFHSCYKSEGCSNHLIAGTDIQRHQANQ